MSAITRMLRLPCHGRLLGSCQATLSQARREFSAKKTDKGKPAPDLSSALEGLQLNGPSKSEQRPDLSSMQGLVIEQRKSKKATFELDLVTSQQDIAPSASSRRPKTGKMLDMDLSLSSGNRLGIFKQQTKAPTQVKVDLTPTTVEHRRRFPGGHDCEDMAYHKGFADASVSVEEQIKQHTNFSSQLARLKDAPPSAKYFCSVASTGLSKNPGMTVQQKQAIMSTLVTTLLDASANAQMN